MPGLQQKWCSMFYAWSSRELTFYVICLVGNRNDVLCSTPGLQQNWRSMFFAWSSTDGALCSLPGIQQNWHSIFCAGSSAELTFYVLCLVGNRIDILCSLPGWQQNWHSMFSAWSATELTFYVLCLVGNRIDILCSLSGRQQNWCSIITVKRNSRLPMYWSRWERRAPYNNINNTRSHTHTHTWTPPPHTHTHTHRHASDRGIGTAVKNAFFNLFFIEPVCLEGGFKRGGRIRVAECLRQIAPNRWASVRKGFFTKFLCLVLVGLVLILFLSYASVTFFMFN